MDFNQLRQLAGIPLNEDVEVMEIVQIPKDADGNPLISLEELVDKMEHCKKAMVLASRLKGDDRKKALSIVMGNFNRVRAALVRILKKEGVDIDLDGNVKEPPRVKTQAELNLGTILKNDARNLADMGRTD